MNIAQLEEKKGEIISDVKVDNTYFMPVELDQPLFVFSDSSICLVLRKTFDFGTRWAFIL